MTPIDNGNDPDTPQQPRLLWDEAVLKEFRKIPESKRDQFLICLEAVRLGLPPPLKHEKLDAAGKGVVELKINGSPAYRCMYTVLKSGDVVVLHVTPKTTNGQDKQLISTTRQRLKRLAPRGR